VKAILGIMGLIEENYRLPLIPVRPENRVILSQALKEAGIL
jgi:4-hydroxy-tetrahydrodipicolinate synthase